GSQNSRRPLTPKASAIPPGKTSTPCLRTSASWCPNDVGGLAVNPPRHALLAIATKVKQDGVLRKAPTSVGDPSRPTSEERLHQPCKMSIDEVPSILRNAHYTLR